MRATAVLIEEHGAIRVILRVLEKINQKIQNNEEINTSDLDKIVELLQVFADQCHHAKEELVLIPTVKKLGIDDSDQLAEIILAEHEQARVYTKSIKEALEKYKSGDKNALSEISNNAQNYIHLIDKHIDKENLNFFPRSDKILSDEDQKVMYEEFEKMEVEKIGIGTHERLHKVVDELKNTYLQ